MKKRKNKKLTTNILYGVAALLLFGAVCGTLNALVNPNENEDKDKIINNVLEIEDIYFNEENNYSLTDSLLSYKGKHTSYDEKYIENSTRGDEFKASNDAYVYSCCTDTNAIDTKCALDFTFEPSNYVTLDNYNLKLRFAFIDDSSAIDNGLGSYNEENIFFPSYDNLGSVLDVSFNGTMLDGSTFSVYVGSTDAFYWLEVDLGNFEFTDKVNIKINNGWFDVAYDCLMFSEPSTSNVKSLAMLKSNVEESNDSLELTTMLEEDPYADEYIWGKLD